MNGTIDDPVSYAENVVGKDPFASYLGVKVEEVREGYARCSLTIRPEYLNAVERAHGAAVFAVVDQAFAVASNSTGNMAVAVNFNINYLSAANDGEKIFAEASPLNMGRKLSVWQVEVRGFDDRLIAAGQGTVYHK